MVKKLLCIIFFLVFFLAVSFHASAQKEGNIWYFGNFAGIDFNTGAAFPLVDGALSTLDGCATISNANGKLLFYTDGLTVYDNTHHIMPHGTGLAGGLTSTQSAVIIPKPFNSNVYYVFTVDYEMGPKGLEYSIIDMTRNGGKGDVVTKNIKLRTPVCEKLTAVQHSNKKDIWVIAHNDSDSYLAYLVTDSGVRTKPVISKGGVNVSSSVFNAKGYLKVSSGGNKLASAIKYLNLIETGDFDNNTGKVSGLQVIPNVNTVYGIEFSPDNTKMYATNYFDRQLYQYDITTNNITTIISSKTTIFTSPAALAAIQQAPDGKIYVSRDASTKMGVITNPNKPGTACKYVDLGFDLNGRKCESGLPTFVQSFFIPVTDFVFLHTCLGDQTTFIGKTNINPDSWYWNFDDPVSTSHNTDNIQNPVHSFTSVGIYNVIMVISLNGAKDTIRKTVVIDDVPSINLGPDQNTCSGNSVNLDAGIAKLKYHWNTGDTVQKIKADTSGTYWVTVTKGACSRSDTTSVNFIPISNYKLGKDTIVCLGTPFTLTKSIKGARILWSTGETDTSITVTKTGFYWIRVSIGSCTVYDSILVFFQEPPVVNLGRDTMLCEGEIDTLDSRADHVFYLWSTGEKTKKIAVQNGGKYWVQATANYGCKASDTINILHCLAKVYIPDAFTPNNDSLNDVFKPYGTDINRAELTVVNRWGEIVYHEDAIERGWDGNFNGISCPTGVYGYRLLYREYVGEVLYDRQLTGKVFLIR